MRPKGKLFALFAIFAAIGLVTATGAFTTVEADRQVTVEVQGDASALLALDATDTTTYPNGAYAEQSGNQLQIALNSSNNPGEGGTGINKNAVTKLDNVFKITNQGTQDVDISVSATVNTPSNGFSAGTDIYFYQGGDESTDLSSTDFTTVSPGTTERVGMYIDSNGLGTGDTVDVTLTINATDSDGATPTP